MTGSLTTFDRYQAEAQKTANKTLALELRLLVSTCGLASEAGELAGLVQKAFERGTELDTEQVLDEAGDCLWRLADILAILDRDMQDAAFVNIQKLRARYAAGFTASESIARRDEATVG